MGSNVGEKVIVGMYMKEMLCPQGHPPCFLDAMRRAILLPLTLCVMLCLIIGLKPGTELYEAMIQNKHLLP